MPSDPRVDVLAAAARLVEIGELYEKFPLNKNYSGDLLLVARYAQAAHAELARYRAALEGIEKSARWWSSKVKNEGESIIHKRHADMARAALTPAPQEDER